MEAIETTLRKLQPQPLASSTVARLCSCRMNTAYTAGQVSHFSAALPLPDLLAVPIHMRRHSKELARQNEPTTTHQVLRTWSRIHIVVHPASYVEATAATSLVATGVVVLSPRQQRQSR